MLLSDFGAEIDPVILERGHDYFVQENASLEKKDGENYEFHVRGSADYKVFIELENQTIRAWQCNCPYDMGPICKHVVAAMYVLRDGPPAPSQIKISETKQKKKRQTKAEKFKSILSQLDLEELKEFVTQIANSDTDFRNIFLARFSSKTGNGKTNYKTMLKEILRTGTKQGFIDYQASFRVMRMVFEVLAQTDGLLSKSRFDEAFDLNVAVLETVSEAIAYMDDSSGEAGTAIDEAFENLHELAKETSYLERVFDYAMEQGHKKQYSDFGLQYSFYDIIVTSAGALDRCDEALNYFDTILEDHQDHETYSSRYRYQNLMEYKYQLLIHSGQEEKAEQLITDFIHLTPFRKKRFERYVNEKKYSEAMKLCDAGVDQAIEEEYRGLVRDWRERKLQAAELSGDIEEVRNLARTLYTEGRDSIEYLRKLRSTYSESDWPVVRNEVIQTLKKKRRPETALMELYSEEELLSELLYMVTEELSISVLKRYAPQLMKKFPNDILVLFKTSILDFSGRNVGRSHYRQLVSDLKYLAKLDKGDTLAKELSHEICERYPNRPAMLEELKMSGLLFTAS